MAEEERVALTGLEQRFSGDKDKVELNKLLAELDDYLAKVKRVLDSGLAPQEFRKMTKYRTALEEARDAATKAWALTIKL